MLDEKNFARLRSKNWPGSAQGASWTYLKTLHLVQFGKCFYCLKEINDLSKTSKEYSIDHITPKSLGGTGEFFNLVLSCPECNCLKSSHEVDPEWVKERLEYFCRGGEGEPFPDIQ